MLSIWRVVKWTSLLILAIGIILIIFLYNLDPDDHYDQQHLPTEGNTVTFVLLDGLSQEIFAKELRRGNLSVLQELIEESTYIENGVGSFPTMTGYAFYPFLTGRDAVHSGIFGLRWFDRSRVKGNLRNYVGRTNVQMNKDIRKDVPTLFELYTGNYTASINTYMNRGVHHSLKTGWAHTTAKYSKNSIFPWLRGIPFVGKDIAKDHFQHETLVTDLAIEQLRKNPKVQWITYPSLDAHNHVHGTDDIYYHLLYHLENQINRLSDAIESLGHNNRALVIVSDHGVSDVEVNIDIPGKLADQGLNLERGPSTHLDTEELNTAIEDFIDRDGYFVINGNLGAFLYMKNANDSGIPAWQDAHSTKELSDYKGVNIPLFISNLEGIDMVATFDIKEGVSVFKNKSIVNIQKDSLNRYSYRNFGADPFNYHGVLSQDTFYTREDILSKTIETHYPYAIVRLYDLLSQANAPDLVMTSLPGFDLAKDYEIFVDNYLGGHGGIRKEQIVVPYIAYFPNTKGKRILTMTAEDLGKEVIKFLEE